MDDLQLIHHLTNQLGKAASDQDWLVLQQTDKSIAALLTSLKGHELSPEKRHAISQLQDVYRKVYAYCQQQSDILEGKMMRSQRNREGTLAYAAFMDEEDIR